MATPTAEETRRLVSLGYAMPDGSYYIRDGAQGVADLDNAVKAVGRATPNAGESEVERRNSVRRHIMKRAKALNRTDMIPDTWNPDGSLKHSDLDEWLAHFGVRGMRWGVRKDRGGSPPAHADAARAQHLQAQVKKAGGTHTLSNTDLKALNERLQLESQHQRLTAPPEHPGEKFAREVISNTGKQVAQKALLSGAEKGAGYLLKKYGGKKK